MGMVRAAAKLCIALIIDDFGLTSIPSGKPATCNRSLFLRARRR